MTLTTHILVGGAASSPFIATGNIPLAFGTALLSHYIIDMIPHWGYEIPFISNPADRENRAFVKDFRIIVKTFSKVLLDMLLGSVILFFLVKPEFNFSEILFLLFVIAGSVLPDALQGLQTLYKGWPMNWFQKLHDIFHFDTKKYNGELPANFFSISSQLAMILVSIIVIL